MSLYSNLRISELNRMLAERGLVATDMRKTALISILTHIDNGNLKIGQPFYENDTIEEITNLSLKVKELEKEVEAKSCYIDRIKDNSSFFESIAIENETTLNEKITGQEETIKALKNQIVTLNSSLSDYICKTCETRRAENEELRQVLDSKSLQIVNLTSQIKNLDTAVSDLETELAEVKNTEVLASEISTQTDQLLMDPKSHFGNNCSNAKHKILFVADSQGRNCGGFLRELFSNDKYDTFSIFKPNALLENVIEDIDKLSKDFGKNDYVLVLGGSNNALRSKSISKECVEQLKTTSLRTNLILLLAPLREGHIDYNSNILQNNLILLSSLNESATFINSNHYLVNSNFSKSGLHLNAMGKAILLRVAKRVIHRQSDNIFASEKFFF